MLNITIIFVFICVLVIILNVLVIILNVLVIILAENLTPARQWLSKSLT